MWERMIKRCEIIGFNRAASMLQSQHGITQEHVNQLREAADEARKELQKMKIKDSYEAGDHYMRGKSVATWKGKAHV
jgi:hypothetical protein